MRLEKDGELRSDTFTLKVTFDSNNIASKWSNEV